MKLLALFLLSLLAGCAGPTFSLRPVDLQDLREQRARVSALLRDHAVHQAVYLQVENVLEHDVEFSSGAWTARNMHIERHLVIDAADEDVSTFRRVIKKGWQIRRAEIVILPPEGEARRFSEKDLVREQAEGGKTRYKLAYPEVSRGTLIEARWEEYCQDPWEHWNWSLNSPLRFRYPAEKAAAALVVPDDWGLRIKRTGPNLTAGAEIYRSKGKAVVIARREQVAAQPEESFSPFEDEDGDYLRVAIAGARLPRKIHWGAENWQQQVKLLQEYFLDRDEPFSRRVSERSKKICRGLPDKPACFRAIVSWVRQNITLDEWEKKDFADLLESRRGSRTQIAGLTYQLLAKAKLPATFVLIHSAEDGYFDRNFVTLLEPDVAALLVTIDGQEQLAFPYLKWLPVGLVPEPLQDRPAIKVDRNGFTGFWTTPRHEADQALTEERFQLRLTPEGVLAVEEEQAYSGLRAYQLREKLADLRGDKLQRKLAKLVGYSEGKVALDKAEVINRDNLDQPLVLRFRYTIDNLVSLADGEAILQTAGLFSSSSRYKKISGKRVRPLSNRQPTRYQRQIELVLPDGWLLQETPPNARFANKFGRLQVSYEAKDSRLRVHQEFVLHRFAEPASAYPALRDFLDKRSVLNMPTLVLRTR